MMMIRAGHCLAIVLALARNALARTVINTVAPEITTVAQGYNIIAKLPCVGCPFLYQDTSKGSDEGWTTRTDESALLLNISLPFDSAHLSINDGAFLTESKILPKIYANQILLDTSTSDMDKLISNNALDTPGGGYFGLSYAYNLDKVANSRALLFRFDVLDLFSDLTPEPLTVPLKSPRQKVLELVFLPRPLLSAGDPSNTFEIVHAQLLRRPTGVPRKGRRTMWFSDWDDHGKKGTTSHALNSAGDSFVDYISSGVWSLFVFIMAVVGLFVVLIILIIFGCGWHKDDYERAQHGKRRNDRGSGTWGRNDVEKARRFKTPEELGFRNAGRVVGVGKSD